MSDWSFKNLNLGGVNVQKSSGMLKPGRWVCRITNAELKTTKSGGRQVAAELTELDGNGKITDYINIMVPKSEKATEIGLERLMALYTYGGHPDPHNANREGLKESLVGLVVGVVVEPSEYTDQKTGEKRNGSQLKDFGAYFDPAEIGYVRQGGDKTDAPGGGEDLDDEIPF